MSNLILCLDFDGTIHSYESGWQGAEVISDSPIKGSFEFISDAAKHFDVHVYSARNGLPGGIDAMKVWFIQYGWPEGSTGDPEGLSFPTCRGCPEFCVNG